MLLVEKYYPELIPYPVPRRRAYDGARQDDEGGLWPAHQDCFLGPCISKIHEAQESDGAIDAVVLFDELMQWLEAEGVDLEAGGPGRARDESNREPVLYPIGGIIQTLDRPIRQAYKCVAVDGIDRCAEVLDSLKSGELENFFLEMNACRAAVSAGPGAKEIGYSLPAH